MDITISEVREALRKDDFTEMNVEIGRYIDSAKSALYAAVGLKTDGAYFNVKPIYAHEFEALSNTYIMEYCRARLDLVDNDKVLNTIATQLETFIIKEGIDDAS